MDILITHGYMLSGTGSNLYVRNLVRNYCKEGHNVLLLSQDPDPLSQDFISKSFAFGKDNLNYKQEGEKDTPYEGNCIHFRPYLHGFLPVYVYDHYEGFEVKEFTDCSREEVNQYVSWNRTALKTVVRDFHPEVLNTNHTVMFPFIAASVAREHHIPHYVTVHGSALNFTVKKDPVFLPYAMEGFESADNIIVDSEHAKAELEEFFDKHQWYDLREKIVLIPAGVDIENFNINDDKASSIQKLMYSLGSSDDGTGRKRETDTLLWEDLPLKAERLEKRIEDVRLSYDYKFTDQHAGTKLRYVAVTDPLVLYVGKYLWTKGIYLELLSIPFILQKFPDTKFVFAGFGPFREVAEVILNLMAKGRLNKLKELSSDSKLFKGEGSKALPLFTEILEQHDKKIKAAVESLNFDLRSNTIFTGIVNHDQLKDLLPASDILVAPSVFPEAFGMVGVEAMASGVLPVLTYQSAFREIADITGEITERHGLHQNKVELNTEVLTNLSDNIVNFLQWKSCRGEEINLLRNDLREIAADRFSWKGIAAKYLSLFKRRNVAV